MQGRVWVEHEAALALGAGKLPRNLHWKAANLAESSLSTHLIRRFSKTQNKHEFDVAQIWTQVASFLLK